VEGWQPLDLCGIMSIYSWVAGWARGLADVQNGLLARPQRAKGRVILLYVRRASKWSENAARSLFQHQTERGRPVSTGIPIPPWHVELSGTRTTPGKCNCQSRTGTRSLISC